MRGNGSCDLDTSNNPPTTADDDSQRDRHERGCSLPVRVFLTIMRKKKEKEATTSFIYRHMHFVPVSVFCPGNGGKFVFGIVFRMEGME